MTRRLDLKDVAEELFPLPRSITGQGIRDSARILGQWIPLSEHKVPSREPIFDWTAPLEWNLRRARLWGPDGSLIVDSRRSNLHVVNFSEAFSGEVHLEELEEHLYSLPELPDAIPYVTSYYKPRWGLCLSHDLRVNLRKGRYRVDIDTELTPGFLRYWTASLPATVQTTKTVLLSTYLCHPSMGNNELSGPLTMLLMYELLKSRTRLTNYTFLVAPETIGSLAFLAQQSREALEAISSGLVLTCLGGPERVLSFKHSRRHWLAEPSSFDSLCEDLAMRDAEKFNTRSFDPSEGSDERQFCSPGFNLPVLQVSRTQYGRYEEYHTSLDTLEFMNFEMIEDSATKIDQVLSALEMASLKPRSTVMYGEAFLSGRDLYPDRNIGGQLNSDETALRMRILNLADGSRQVSDLWAHLDISPLQVAAEISRLKEASLVEFLD